MGGGHGLDRPLALGVVGLRHLHRLLGCHHGRGAGLEGLVLRGQHAHDRPDAARGRASREDRLEMRLVGACQRLVDGPGQGIAGWQSDEIDEFLLGGDEFCAGVGQISPGGGQGHVEHGPVMRIATGGNQLQPFERFGAPAEHRESGRHLPIRLRDPKPPRAVSRTLERLHQRQRTGIRGRETRARRSGRCRGGAAAWVAAEARFERLERSRQNVGGDTGVGRVATAGRGRCRHDGDRAICRRLARGRFRGGGQDRWREEDRQRQDAAE